MTQSFAAEVVFIHFAFTIHLTFHPLSFLKETSWITTQIPSLPHPLHTQRQPHIKAHQT
ncbi:unnamed protein product, partial [Prunus brigantina]